MNTIQINPIFGPAKYEIQDKLAFILMPFEDKLTEIYNHKIKPTLEDEPFLFKCKRADDIVSNKSIMEDIWKSICEARIIIADITGFNPNVMYELGIAHTLGKTTIILCQKGEKTFPFDLHHIRRIEYENTAIGGDSLTKSLSKTLDSVLDKELRRV